MVDKTITAYRQWMIKVTVTKNSNSEKYHPPHGCGPLGGNALQYLMLLATTYTECYF